MRVITLQLIYPWYESNNTHGSEGVITLHLLYPWYERNHIIINLPMV